MAKKPATKSTFDKNDWTTLHGKDEGANLVTQPVAPGLHGEARRAWKKMGLSVDSKATHQGRCKDVNCQF